MKRGAHDAQCLETAGLLAVGAIHDVNNVLTVIANYADLALEPEPESEAEEPASDLPERLSRLRADLEHIHHAACRGTSLTRRLLRHALPDADDPEEVCIGQVVEETLALLRGPAWRQVAVVTRLQPGCWTVLVDPVRLGQVVLNLAINARDAMPSGGLLTVRTANLTMPGSTGDEPARRYVRLEFSDTGCGIPAEVGDQVFEPFYTTKSAATGTGLGLALARGYVTRAGGEIRFESLPGVGTRFELLFPAVAGSGSGSDPR